MHRHRHTKECSKAEITSWDLKLDAERIHVVKAAAVTGQGYVSTIDFKEQSGPLAKIMLLQSGHTSGWSDKKSHSWTEFKSFSNSA